MMYIKIYTFNLKVIGFQYHNKNKNNNSLSPIFDYISVIAILFYFSFFTLIITAQHKTEKARHKRSITN